MLLSHNKKDLISGVQKHELHHAFSYGISAIMAQGLMMVYTIIVARYLTSEYYGILSACYAMATLASFGVNWGFDIWLLREASIDEDPISITSSILRSKLLLGIVWTILLWALLQIIQPALYLKDISLLVIFDIWFDSCFTTLLVHFVVIKKVNFASTFLIISRLLRLCTAIILILFHRYSLINFSCFRLLSTICILIFVWYILKPNIFSKKIIPFHTLFQFSIPFTISELLNTFYIQSDINILSIFLGDRKIVGNYSLAINLINAILTLPYGIVTTFIPNLVRQKQADYKKYNRLLVILYTVISVISILIIIGLLAFSDVLVNALLGSTYLYTGKLLMLLSPIIFLKCINQVNAAYFISLNFQAKRILPQFSSLLIKIISSIWIVPRWQHSGLAFLSIFSEAILLCGYLLIALRIKLGFRV